MPASELHDHERQGSGRVTGAVLTLPAALDTPSTTLILGETSYAYTPALDYIHMGTTNLYSSIYMVPRQPPSTSASANCGVPLLS